LLILFALTMAEEYAAKMSRKTDAELLLYLRNRAEYREDAVLAALNEAQQRQLPLEEFNPAALRAELEPVVAAQQAEEAKRVAIQTADEEEEKENEPRPVLYSPVTITLFTVFFTMLAGGALLAINFRTLGRSKAILQLVLFLLVYLVLFGLLAGPLLQAGLVLVLLFADLPPIIAYNLWFWPRYVGGQQYRSRSWLAPFLICMLLRIGLGMLLAPWLIQRLTEMGIPVK
jgi:hypothetical protein